MFRPYHEGDDEVILTIASNLRDYFDENALAKMPKDASAHRTYIAEDDTDITGFIILAEPDDQAIASRSAEILWMAVRRDRQGQGVGTTLLKHVIADQQEKVCTHFIVKTLAPTVEYAPYVRTRNFYVKNGFTMQEIIDPYPEWGEGNPCAVYRLDL